MIEILVICLIGGIAGWIAGRIMNTEYNSVLIDILVGIVGGFIGGKLFHGLLHITNNHWIDLTLTSVVGAILLLLIVKIIRRILNL